MREAWFWNNERVNLYYEVVRLSLEFEVYKIRLLEHCRQGCFCLGVYEVMYVINSLFFHGVKCENECNFNPWICLKVNLSISILGDIW